MMAWPDGVGTDAVADAIRAYHQAEGWCRHVLEPPTGDAGGPRWIEAFHLGDVWRVLATAPYADEQITSLLQARYDQFWPQAGTGPDCAA